MGNRNRIGVRLPVGRRNAGAGSRAYYLEGDAMTIGKFDIQFILMLIEEKYGEDLWRYEQRTGQRAKEEVTVERYNRDDHMNPHVEKIDLDVLNFQDRLEHELKIEVLK